MFGRTRFGAWRTRRRRSHSASGNSRPSILRSRKPLFELLEERHLLAITWNIIPLAAGTVVGNGADDVAGNADDETTIAVPAPALAAFNEATRIFDQYLTDTVTVNLELGWGINFDPGTNAFANSPSIGRSYTDVRNALQADQQSTDDSIAFVSLQPAPDFDVLINLTNNNPNGAGSATPYLDNDADANNTALNVKRANAKALGLLPANDATVDGRIVFNSTRMWDLSRADGVSGFDFTGIAAHEIGHFLGFVSGVDVLDFDNQANGQTGRNDDGFDVGSVLDLFRFSTQSVATGGAGTIDFTADGRTKFFSVNGGTTSLGEFGEGDNNGTPGNQASHWQDLMPEIGLMDPTTGVGELDFLTPLDLTAFDVIGWDINADALSATPTLQGTNADDTIVVRLNPSDTTRVQVQLNGTLIATYGVNDIDQLTIEGLGGNDTLIVDSTSGLIGLARAIVFEGGAGQDTLQLNQTGGTQRTSETLTVGATPGSGLDTIIGGGVTQVVRFNDLEPIISNVAVATFVVNGALVGSFLNGANQIVYDQSDLFGGSWGRVTIDAFEPVHFINKDNVIIDAENGDDTIVLNNAALPTLLQRITISAEAGNDEVRLENLPPTGGTFAGVTVDGGSGNDLIDAGAIASVTALTLSGGAGNDTIVGDIGADGATSMGTDTYDGGEGDDVLVIRGTNARNLIDIFQNVPSGQNYTLTVVNGLLSAPPAATTERITSTGGAPGAAGALPTIERTRIEALAGDDVIRVGHADAFIASDVAEQTVAFEVQGGLPNTIDRLVVRDDGPGDLVIQRIGADRRSGSFTIGAMAPIEYDGVEFAELIPLNTTTAQTGADGMGRLVVFKNDAFESNNSLATSWFLGAGVTINADPTIDPGGIDFPPAGPDPLDLPGDRDFFQFVAQETGTLDFQLFFRPVGTLANNRAGLPGNGELTATFFDSDGNQVGTSAPLDIRDASNAKLGERITLPVVRNQTYFVRIQGQTAEAINVYNFTAINIAAPIPQLVDLRADSDSGRHDADNITKIRTPSFDIILDDARVDEFANQNFVPDTVDDDAPTPTNAAGARIDYGIEVFNNGVSIGFAFYTGVDRLWWFTATLGDLGEGGNNFITAAVWVRDPSLPIDQAPIGRHELSNPLQVTLDITTPLVSFGLPDAASIFDGLTAASDTGVVTMPMTFADRITSDTTPRLWGRAEANSIIRVFLDNGNGVIDPMAPIRPDVFLGQTVAVPFDGDDSYPDGYWEITTVLDLNEILGIPKDGLRRLLVTAEDVAGNPMPMNGVISAGVDELQLFIDTQGPQVTNVQVADDLAYDLFDPKPTTNGYTPLVRSLRIAVQDLPNRLDQPGGFNDFIHRALVFENAFTPQVDNASNPGNYLLVGDHVGTIAIQSVTVESPPGTNGNPALATIVLSFFAPLPDDRYTLTVRDSLVDPVGNKLDGESNAVEPQESPSFVSGDGVPDGNFVARFTIDSRPELGSHVAQDVDIDINGNFVWDPANAQIGNDSTNVDLSFTLPVANTDGSVGLGGYNVHDLLFAGKFRPVVGQNENGGNGVNGNSGENGTDAPRYFDQLAAYGHSAQLGGFRWIIDTNSDGVVTLGTDIRTTQPLLKNFDVAGAIPIAGNFDGNAANGDEIGLYNAGRWARDTNRNFVIDAGEVSSSGDLFGAPIVGDFDGDGNDDLAVFNNNQFFFSLDGNVFADAGLVLTWGFPGVLDRPVAADMDQDGIDDIGLWVPRNSASLPRNVAEWYFLISNDPQDGSLARVAGTINRLNHAFTVAPFGHDLFAEFGDSRSLPIVGNFDPPVAAALPGGGAELAGDYDRNGRVDNADKDVWRAGFGSSSNHAADGNHDGRVDASDYVIWRNNFGKTVGHAAMLVAPADGETIFAATRHGIDAPSHSGVHSIAPLTADESTDGGPARIAAVDGFFSSLSDRAPTRPLSRPIYLSTTAEDDEDLLVAQFADSAALDQPGPTPSVEWVDRPSNESDEIFNLELVAIDDLFD